MEQNNEKAGDTSLKEGAMKIVTGEEVKGTTFEELEEGETFFAEGEEQVQIKTDEGSGCCLETGILTDYDDPTKVVRVSCEVHITGE